MIEKITRFLMALCMERSHESACEEESNWSSTCRVSTVLMRYTWRREDILSPRSMRAPFRSTHSSGLFTIPPVFWEHNLFGEILRVIASFTGNWLLWTWAEFIRGTAMSPSLFTSTEVSYMQMKHKDIIFIWVILMTVILTNLSYRVFNR